MLRWAPRGWTDSAAIMEPLLIDGRGL